ncbi:MAG: hypothetical protein E7051_03165 [Lentisphaerae bacterium]|nr:hypothetical protein [Lentisphaerota bacterium]
MRVLPLLLIFLCGCFLREKPAAVTQECLLKSVLDRHLEGETASALQHFARRSRQATRWSKLPDMAAFVRSDTGSRKDIISREILWESVVFCTVQFIPEPETFIRKWNAGELRCRLMLLLSEREFLQSVIWKTAEQQSREKELYIEILQLAGSADDEVLASVPLVSPQVWERTPLPLALPVSQDPAEALQAAGVFYLMPEEIRRQQLSTPDMPLDGILLEMQSAAATYVLYLVQNQLEAAQKAYIKAPTPENLWNFRQWYYRYQLDISRLPQTRGREKDREFIQSMLLLQPGF